MKSLILILIVTAFPAFAGNVDMHCERYSEIRVPRQPECSEAIKEQQFLNALNEINKVYANEEKQATIRFELGTREFNQKSYRTNQTVFHLFMEHVLGIFEPFCSGDGAKYTALCNDVTALRANKQTVIETMNAVDGRIREFANACAKPGNFGRKLDHLTKPCSPDGLAELLGAYRYVGSGPHGDSQGIVDYDVPALARFSMGIVRDISENKSQGFYFQILPYSGSTSPGGIEAKCIRLFEGDSVNCKFKIRLNVEENHTAGSSNLVPGTWVLLAKDFSPKVGDPTLEQFQKFYEQLGGRKLTLKSDKGYLRQSDFDRETATLTLFYKDPINWNPLMCAGDVQCARADRRELRTSQPILDLVVR